MKIPRLLCVALVIFDASKASPGDALETEDACERQADRDVTYSCRGGQYLVKGTPFKYVDVTCEGIKLNCSTFPRKEFSKNSTLDQISLRNCLYEEPVACLLRRLGGADVDKLLLRDFLSPVTRRHVQGLTALTALYVYDKGVQSAIPYDVISALPNLTHFRLNRARLTLAPRQFQAPRLRNLELLYDSIADLPPGAFEGLPELDYLTLRHNKITTLQNDMFRGLDNLRTLILTDNPISSWFSGALSSLRKLQHLGITTTHVPDGALQELPQLQNITITSPISLQLRNRTFGNLNSLRNVVLANCNIQDLPGAVFHGTKLFELSLKKNQLTTLHPSLFRGQTEMTKLNLNGNRLKEVSNDLFLSLKKLIELDISSNQIESFDNYVFSPLVRLRILTASNNRLTHIEESAFRNIPLQILDLAGNRLSFMSDPFVYLAELKLLKLHHNNIDRMSRSWKIYLSNLISLDISHNKFTELDESDFYYPNNAHLAVNLQHNRISSVALNDAMYTRATFFLDHNPLNCDCNLYDFVKMANSPEYSSHFHIEGLKCASPPNLEGTKLANVPYDGFECKEANCTPACECVSRPSRGLLEARCDALGAPSRLPDDTEPVALKLSHAPTSLRYLPFGNVVEIDLSGLNLTEVPHDGFPETVRLLNLSDNRLQRLPDALLDRDVRLALAANPLACDCRSQEHVARLLRNVTRIADLARASCSDGTVLALVDPRRLCDVWLATSIGVSLAALGVLCAALAAVASRYSFELKLYAAKYLPWLLPEEKYDASKKYDVFVSYAHQDEEFVRDRLLARLEGPPLRLRACVHHRDWLAGESIPYNIAKSVAESRRTVIVLSEHFLGSVWGLMEFRAAHVQAAREGRARVVVLLLQDVCERKELDRELRAYLHTNTYVRWGEPWFWEKLAYALPKRGAAVDRAEERRLQATADKLVHRGLDVTLNEEGKLVNAA